MKYISKVVSGIFDETAMPEAAFQIVGGPEEGDGKDNCGARERP
ncbi:hypothetical protein [Paraburkholderia phytofirmans]